MNKKISKIITGISVLGCLGTFIPNGANAVNCRKIYEQENCTKESSCEWRAEYQCQGSKPDCKNYTTLQDCTDHGCPIWWGKKPTLKTCHQKAVSSKK